MSSVAAHAEAVLASPDLATKLKPWPRRLDLAGAAPVPRSPARLPEMALPTQRRKMPSLRGIRLEDAGQRVRLLHELANHELQALELLAWALLRWPEAPAGFRRGLVTTLADEQRHMALYIQRIEALGGAFGTQPLSGFFWDSLSRCETPAQFAAGLSLCFEVANLDFCMHWGARFRQAGDVETTEVLDVVYRDEIRHVGHGLTWFPELTGCERAERVDVWRRTLPAPLTPARSRGPLFDAAGREEAGFTPSEVAKLKVLGGSRGRPPVVRWFSAELEDEIADGRPSTMARTVTHDLASLPMFLCGAQDAVVAPPLRTAFATRLAQAGFVVPAFTNSPRAQEFGGQPVQKLEPWALHPGLGAHVAPWNVEARDPTAEWSDAFRVLSSKCEATQRAHAYRDHPAVLDELGEVLSAPPSELAHPTLFKAPYSTSGTRRRVVQALDDKWLAKQRYPMVAQPLYDVVADLSAHAMVGERLEFNGITRFHTERGSYRGAWLAPWSRGLPSEIRRFVHGDGKRSHAVGPLLERVVLDAARWAQSLGYAGPISVDAVIVRTEEGLKVHPWLETNARYTLARVGTALQPRVHPHAGAWWRIAPATTELRARLEHAPPPVLEHGRIVSGILPTTDPVRAKRLLTWIEA